MELSSFGVLLSLSSFGFAYCGHKIDVFLQTSPMFMLGLLFLSIFICLYKMYQKIKEEQHQFHQ
jgi:F0F1-type ATP synthase assembly protein I